MALQPGASTSLWRTLGSSSEVSQTSPQEGRRTTATYLWGVYNDPVPSRMLSQQQTTPSTQQQSWWWHWHFDPRPFPGGSSTSGTPWSNQSPPLLRRWMLCQAMTQHCWTRWYSEYLQQLQWLAKWRTPHRNPQVRDIVLIKEDTLVTTHWPLAWIVSTSPGHDGHSRVVVIKTSTGTYKRPHHLGSLTTATRTRRKGRSVLWWAVCWGSSRLIFWSETSTSSTPSHSPNELRTILLPHLPCPKGGNLPFSGLTSC